MENGLEAEQKSRNRVSVASVHPSALSILASEGECSTLRLVEVAARRRKRSYRRSVGGETFYVSSAGSTEEYDELDSFEAPESKEDEEDSESYTLQEGSSDESRGTGREEQPTETMEEGEVGGGGATDGKGEKEHGQGGSGRVERSRGTEEREMGEEEKRRSEGDGEHAASEGGVMVEGDGEGAEKNGRKDEAG
eukprot:Sspe_Gene.69106::Locus_40733_Transcript_1_1_Confidence_1.000_Length_636::g.69106::m.69106